MIYPVSVVLGKPRVPDGVLFLLKERLIVLRDKADAGSCFWYVMKEIVTGCTNGRHTISRDLLHPPGSTLARKTNDCWPARK